MAFLVSNHKEAGTQPTQIQWLSSVSQAELSQRSSQSYDLCILLDWCGTGQLQKTSPTLVTFQKKSGWNSVALSTFNTSYIPHVYLLISVLGIKPRALYTVGKCSTTNLYFQSLSLLTLWAGIERDGGPWRTDENHWRKWAVGGKAELTTVDKELWTPGLQKLVVHSLTVEKNKQLSSSYTQSWFAGKASHNLVCLVNKL